MVIIYPDQSSSTTWILKNEEMIFKFIFEFSVFSFVFSIVWYIPTFVSTLVLQREIN